jgi:radical SAM superfamily enzyme YgiQ (UPF0313 family)
MLALVNTNTMQPPVTPVGLDYIAGAVHDAGIECEVVDLCLCENPSEELAKQLAAGEPELVALSFRNIDDCFWPSAQWFVPRLSDLVTQVRENTDAPIVLGGVGFSIMPEGIVDFTGADFGIRGDGEQPLVQLIREIRNNQNWHEVLGLIWREDGQVHSNEPAWPRKTSLPTGRDFVDNKTYFKKGGQCGIETKRGCNRPCVYCADPLAKGKHLRLRDAAEVADEVENLLGQGIDVLHLCDSEFNIPIEHSKEVCREFIHRRLGEKIRWYTYMAVTPFDDELAKLMRKAGCVGIDFTADSACGIMLSNYRDAHSAEDLATAVQLCRDYDITVMLDLLLAGPGETEETLAETIEFVKQIEPDCVGAGLGVRIYPGTGMAVIAESEGVLESNPNIKRKYDGPVDLLKPTFYISNLLGQQPAQLVHDLIGDDERFFKPLLGAGDSRSTDHNYNDNTALCEAISAGARGAYWDILRKMRK